MPNLSRTSMCLRAVLALAAIASSAVAADTYSPSRGVARREQPESRGGVQTNFRLPSDNSIDSVDAAPSKQSIAPATKSVPLASKRLPPAVGDSSPPASGWSTLFSALGSLSVVLGLFLVVVWFLRRTGPRSMSALPTEVFEVLGHSPLAGRQQAQLVRCGGKLLLLSITTGSAETLTEITEPAEVDRITGLCQQARPNSATASFRNLFAQFSGEGRADEASAPRRGLLGFGRLPQSSAEVADA